MHGANTHNLKQGFANNMNRVIRNKSNRTRVNKVKKWMWKIVRSIFLVGFCFVILYPVIIMVSKALMDRMDIYDNSVILIPKHFTLENFKFAWEQMNFGEALKNSLLLSFIVTVLQTIACLLAGYGFARFSFKFKNFFFGLVIFTLIVPPQLVMVPMFLHFRFFDFFGLVQLFTGKKGINLLDTFAPFLLLAATGMGLKNGLFIYIFRQFFRGMPKETEESALVDGAGSFRTFYQIMLPGAITSITTVVLFSFVWQYNDVVYSALFLKENKVLSIVYSSLGQFLTWQVGNGGIDQAQAKDPYIIAQIKSTGVLMMVTPLIILYLCSQKFFVDSIERSGIVG